jgi:hypothetical protein
VCRLHERLPAAVRARLAVILGALLIVAGVWVLFGYGVALLVAGVALAAYGLLLVDVDERPNRTREVRR